MTPDEFAVEGKRLETNFPGTKNLPHRRAELWRAFGNTITAEQWRQAVNVAIDTLDYYPKVKEARRCAGLHTETEGRIGKPISWGPGCGQCSFGKIHFEVEHGDVSYTRYLACDCEAGDQIAAHLHQIWKLMKRRAGPAHYSEVYGEITNSSSTHHGRTQPP